MTRLPRVYLIRHGETEWSISGQHTGLSDIPLTPRGEEMVTALGTRIVGEGKLLDPKNIQKIFVSPRIRAQKTFELIFSSFPTLPEYTTEANVREWEYGVAEGLKTSQIKKLANHENWDIWTQGCVDGESAQEMETRIDGMIEKILELTEGFHKDKVEGVHGNGDIVIVSHGHFSRCFLTRWAGLALTNGRIFVTSPGAVSICGYGHENFEERSIMGMNLFGEI